MMQDAELKDLASDIKERGLLNPSARYVLSRNLHRRHLTGAQRAASGSVMLLLLRAEAKKRQATAQPGIRGRASLVEDSPQAIETGKTRAIAAKAVGVSEWSVRVANVVRKADPAAFQRLCSASGRYTVQIERRC
jgi:hypothetical protein